MSDVRHLILAEVVRLVTADPALAALDGRVFDGPPQGATHPFLMIGEVASSDLDGEATPAVAHRIELVAVSATGRMEASAIADRVRVLLESGAMVLTGHALVGARHASTAVTADKDGQAWRGRLVMRVVTEAN